MHTAFGALAAVVAATAMWSGSVSDSKLESRPDFVAAGCHAAVKAKVCAVALRYLAALDLDRTRQACALLERSTLQAAGGMTGCRKRLARANGIRIRYGILTVRASQLGGTVRFSTWARGSRPVRQQMFVSPPGWIVAIIFEP